MNKPIISATLLAIACSICFIIGFLSSEAYQFEKKRIITETISEYSGVKDLFDWYSRVMWTKITLDDLNNITNLNELDRFREKKKENLKSHIKIIKEKIHKLKNNAPNPEALEQLEFSIVEIEKTIEN